MHKAKIKAKIKEVFFSLQGEGPYLGTGHIFVRFDACNINCVYCDTQAKINRKADKVKEYTVPQLTTRVLALQKKNNAQFLSLTGGEPLLYVDFIKEFLKKIKQKKLLIYLETNGILYADFAQIRELIDIVAMDVKLPSSGKHKSFWLEHEKFLKLCRGKNIFIKAIICLKTTIADIKKLTNLIARVDRNKILILQPNSDDLSKELIKKMMMFKQIAQNKIKDVRIIPQMHKLIGVK
ncbi:MAG: 7-carboxy-7-deazaguanine synthase QueE [Candidatus Omnitrophota bacterium]